MKQQHKNIGQPLQNIGIVSIIVPIYNSATFLRMSLQSIINQTYSHWQAILVNDGSTDNSLEILRHFAAKEKRFSVVNKVNGGVASARNAGLEKAKGKYIVFFDPDDMLYPQFLEIMLKTLSDNDSDMVLCKMKKCDETENLNFCKTYNEYNVINAKYPLELLILRHKPRISISVIAKIFKSEILKNKKFNTSFKLMAEDFDFSLYVFQYIGKISYVRIPLLAYRQNSGSLTHKPLSDQAIDDHLSLLRFSVWRFKDSLDRRLRIKLWARLSKLVFKYCCLEPYFEGKDFLRYWKKYSLKCNQMLKEKTFFPSKLPFAYRFLCFLYLREKWKILQTILNIYKKFKQKRPENY